MHSAIGTSDKTLSSYQDPSYGSIQFVLPILFVLQSLFCTNTITQGFFEKKLGDVLAA